MTELQEIAYNMAKAYKGTTTKEEAIKKVKIIFMEADMNMLMAMWEVLDAFHRITFLNKGLS